MQRNNSIIIIIVGTLAMFILCMVMVTNVRPLYWTERATTTGSEACGRVARGFKEQRDRLSAHLNRMMQQVGMKSCEIEELLSKMNNKTKQVCVVLTAPIPPSHPLSPPLARTQSLAMPDSVPRFAGVSET